MYVPRLMPSMLRKKRSKNHLNSENKPHGPEKDLTNLGSGPKPLAAHCQATQAHPAKPIQKKRAAEKQSGFERDAL